AGSVANPPHSSPSARHRVRTVSQVGLRSPPSRCVIVRHAGLKPWPRLNQNLRSPRETELAETFPIHVVAEWLGNSPKTALAHYTQVTEEHYRKALQIPVQQVAEVRRTEPQGEGEQLPDGGDVRELATCGVSMQDKLM